MYFLNTFLYLLKSLNKTLENGKRNTGKVREICQSENVGTMVMLSDLLHLDMVLDLCHQLGFREFYPKYWKSDGN